MDTLYTPKQVAEKLSLAPFTIRKYIKDGKLKAFKIGNRLRITEKELKRFTETLQKK